MHPSFDVRQPASGLAEGEASRQSLADRIGSGKRTGIAPGEDIFGFA
jgi:hypothetical protein